MLVGYGRTCITPEESVPLAGMGNTSKRMSTSILDDLYATCVAFTDANDQTVLMFTLDQLHANKEWTDRIREAVEEATGVPASHVMVSHTHTHSGPDMYNPEQESIPRYGQMMVARCAQAAKEAMTDRAAAALYAATIQTEGMCFTRHYQGQDENGKPTAHRGVADPVMQVVKITRQDAPALIIVNWQAHATFNNGYTRYDVSADFVGAMRSRMEESTGARFAFFQGASGNLAGRSRIAGEEKAHEYDEYGYALADYALQALEDLQPVADGPVKLLSDEFVVEVDHSDDHLLAKAKEVIKLWYETYDTTASRLLAEKYGMTNYLHAGGINTRASLPASVDFHIDAFRAGDLAFVCAPYEMFGINGMFIKEHSPFSMTVIATSCNCLHGYLAADSAFDYQCYERDYRRYPRGTAEKVADAFVALLEKLR